MNFPILARAIISLTLAAGFISYTGCGNNSVVTPVTTITVNGKTVDQSGNGVAGVTATINGTNTVSASDGSFSIANVTAPYDIKLVQSSGATPSGFVYLGLTTAAPSLLTSGLAAPTNTTTLTVNFPALGANQRALVFFTDNALVETVKNVTTAGASTTNLTVKWPGDAAITGKVIVMVYTVSGTDIVSYDKYGEKTGFALNNGGSSSTTFTASDLSLNPVEQTVTGTLTAPAGYTNLNSRIALTFRSVSSILATSTFATVSGSSYSFVVPTGLPTACKLIIEGSGLGTIAGTITLKSKEVLPNTTGNSIILNATPLLSTPPNAAVSIDTTTNFVYSPGVTDGVNIVQFTSPGKSFFVFTSASNCRIPNLLSSGLGLGSGVACTWAVANYGSLGMDSFVSGPLNNNPAFNSAGTSETRTFTSTP